MRGFFAPYMYMRNRSHIDAREIHYDQIFYSQSFVRRLCNVAQNSQTPIKPIRDYGTDNVYILAFSPWLKVKHCWCPILELGVTVAS